ncbi:Endoplasmic reticulum-Golgi intermediate compartment protein 3 [Aphelenchoides besseyi]|nr:Endoplasmic reticulum-Golgi intermediate compartment protein 3 [Aphelenchoides besseyi]KAI6232316.1 Endoplasmic reticulum-Golgi intermediate compartment protein 3 [Aphelenchoides besseyi]
MFRWFQDFDVYAKPVADVRVRTLFGGVVSLISFTVIAVLFITETLSFLSVEVAQELFVDGTSADMRVEIHFDITFDKIPCAFLSVDAMDISGQSQHDVVDDVFKIRLDANGNNITGASPIRQSINVNSSEAAPTKEVICGSCYGASEGCCNTCDDVKAAYEIRGWTIENLLEIEQCKNDAFVKELREHKDEGCRIYGHVEVAKCEGNFHIAPGAAVISSHHHYHDLHSLSPGTFNTTHIINSLSFGQPFPSKNYPLNGKRFISNKGGIMHQYIVKVVPTIFVYDVTKSGVEEHSYQFSVTRNEKDILAGANGLPGFFVQYSFSPLTVRFEEKRKSFSDFAVRITAIVGGIYTVCSLIDSFMYTSSRAWARKMAANKLT